MKQSQNGDKKNQLLTDVFWCCSYVWNTRPRQEQHLSLGMVSGEYGLKSFKNIAIYTLGLTSLFDLYDLKANPN